MEFFLIVLLTFGIFFCLNLYGKRLTDYEPLTLESADNSPTAFNLIFRILAPNVILILAASILHRLQLPDLVENIWLAVPLQFALRIAFNINRLKIFNWLRYGIIAFASAITAHWLDENILGKPGSLLPDTANLANELWLAVILYSYAALDRVASAQNERGTSRTADFIVTSFESLRKKFGDIVEKQPNRKIRLLTYAILITENFNRPIGVRFLENLTFLFRQKGSYGIMQVTSTKRLSDRDSVKLGSELLSNTYNLVYQNTRDSLMRLGNDLDTSEDSWHISKILERVAWFYNRDDRYAKDVMRVFDILDMHTKNKANVSPEMLETLRLDALYNSQQQKI